ncbi:MAG: efflux RND transporter periplasmic adaptor subunit [Pseudomonadota bacterium]
MSENSETSKKVGTTDPKNKSLGAHVLKRAGQLAITLGVVALSALTVSMAASELERRATASEPSGSAPSTPVSARPVVYQENFVVTRGYIGQIEPQRSLSASFELSGQLSAVHVEEGDTVRAGDVLAELDTALLVADRDRLQASRRAIAAQIEFAEKTVTRNLSLSESGFASTARLDEALARRDELYARDSELAATIASTNIQLEKSRLIAPFDGRVAQRRVDGGESMSPGQPVVDLVEANAPQVRVGLPLDRSKADLQKSEIEIEGARYQAELVALRPDVDPVTRIRFALFRLEDDTQATFGQTARVLLQDRIEAKGFWLPTTSLKEGLRGQWTVLIIDDEMRVRAAPIEILHAETDRIYVRAAIPDGTMLIETGPQRVTLGQTVSVAPNS